MWSEFCEMWFCIAGAILQWPGLVGYCDECGGKPCDQWIQCSRIRQGRCEDCNQPFAECYDLEPSHCTGGCQD